MFAKKKKTKTAEDWVAAAQEYIKKGNFSAATQCCNDALELDSNLHIAHTTMARAWMPGEGYLNILSRIHEELMPQTYVEIGVSQGRSLTLANKNAQTLGIDPRPIIKHELPPKNKMYEMPSDDFFARHQLFEELGAQHLDLAFIDGLHEFEQALKDFINLEKYASSRTVILIHDCFPATELFTLRGSGFGFWAGDVWKVIVCLKETRPDLKINVIPTFPSGLGIISNLDSTSTVLSENLNAVMEKYRHLPYATIEKNFEKQLNLIPNSWDAIRPLVAL